MLRIRLFFCLVTLLLILWGVGAATLMLMRDTVNPMDIRSQRDYRVIAAAYRIRGAIMAINAHVQEMTTSPIADPAVKRNVFDQVRRDIGENLSILRTGTREDEDWAEKVRNLQHTLDGYFAQYERLFETAPESAARNRIHHYIGGLSLRMNRQVDAIARIAEEKMARGTSRFAREPDKNIWFVVTLVTMGTLISVVIYAELIKHLVDPVSSLRLSIEEIRKGNFEQVLPKPSHGSEFSGMVTSFNEMAAELKLRRSESDIDLLRANLVNRAILEAIPSPVFLVGDDNTIVQINRAAECLTADLGVSGALPEKIQHILDSCQQSSTNYLPQEPKDAVLFRIKEQEFYYLPRVFRFDPGIAARAGWAILLENVSRIRWLDEMKTNLLATVSHEIKTPLTSIRMALLLLLEERCGNLKPKQHMLVSTASGNCDRLLTTLNNLLELSRAESGTTQLARKPLALQGCVERCMELFVGTAAARGIRFVLETPDQELPDVLADSVQLEEVLNNLISNAIKHSPVAEEITVRLTALDDPFVRVSVIDRGPGVPEESQSRVFDRFYRSPGEQVQGVGLGLFISREIMRAHEGRIGLMERRGNVTEFYIDVPIASESGRPPSQSPAGGGDHQEHEEDDEENLGDARGGSGYAGEAQQARNNRQDKEDERPTKHDV